MPVPVLIGLLAFLLIAVLVATLRGRGAANGASRQSAVIVILLVAVAGLILFYLFGR